jgi:O-antigen/teichoic acid export membrane protein
MTASGSNGKFKELFGHGAVYGIGSVLQALLGFVLIPLYTKNLSPEMYGAWALITLCGTLAGVVFYLGVSSALARSYYDYPEGPGRKAAVNTALLMTGLGAATQITAGLVWGDRLSAAVFGTAEFAPHVRLALVGSAFGFLNQLFYVLLRFERRSTAVIALNLGSLLSGICLIVYLLVVRELGVLAPVLGEALNQLLLLAALGWTCRNWLGGGISRREIRLQLAFGLPTVVTGLMYYLHSAGDRFWIKKYGDLTDVGVYALAARIGMLIQVLLIIPFGQIWTPVRLEMKDKPGAAEFFGRVLTYYLLAGLTFALTLTLFSPEVVGLLARQADYAAAAKAVPLVVCAHLIYGLVGVLDAGIIFSRQIYLTATMAAVALAANAASNILLVPRLGFIGAGCSLLISMSVFSIGIGLVANRLFPVVVEWKRVALGVGLFGAALLAGAAIGVKVTFGAVALKSTVVAAVAFGFYRVVLDRSERHSATESVAGLISRVRRLAA